MTALVFRRCYPQHIMFLHAQDVQEPEQRRVFASGEMLAMEGALAQSAWLEERCIAAAGLIPMGEGRAFAWALLGREVRPYLLTISRRIVGMLNTCEFRRVEMVVRADFKQGQMWARMLGFECETPEPMRAYFADGMAAYQYARINEQWQSRSQSLAA